MFGVNLSGAEFGSGVGRYGWDYIYPSSSTIEYYAGKGVDTIRLPVKWERLQHTLNGELDAAEISRIKSVLDSAQANGVKVILDIHNYGGYNEVRIGSDGVSIENFSDLWGKLATEFKSHPAIEGYGLMNEPVGFANQNIWPEAAQAAIDAIRTADTSTAIYVAGQNWGSAMDWPMFNDDLKYLHDASNKLVFEAHQYFDRWNSGTYQGTYDSEGAYADIGVDRLQPFLKWLEDNNLKGFIGEYAVPDNDPRWLIVMDNFLAELAAHNVSSAYWGGGPWWGNYPMSIEPNGTADSAQMMILKKNIQAYAADSSSDPDDGVMPPLIYEIEGSIRADKITGVSTMVNILYGHNGNDVIKGGNLDDALYGENDHDRLYGGDGADYMEGGHGNDYLYGDSGNDSLHGGIGNDYLYGLLGDDGIFGGEGNDRLEGGDGNDALSGDIGNDTLYGQAGDDLLDGGDGNDYLSGGYGNDSLNGGNGNDTLYGQDQDDNLNGNDGNDYLNGGSGRDNLNGGAGTDRLYGIYGNDTLYGGDGNDLLDGGTENDELYGESGDDTLYGQAGNDELVGGAGKDRLYGGIGNDIISGGEGVDYLSGGLGKDVFIFESAAAFTGIDTIADFKKKDMDQIDLSSLLSGYDPVSHAIADFVLITTKGRDSIINVDSDGGDGGDSFTQIAIVKGVTGLNNVQSMVDDGYISII